MLLSMLNVLYLYNSTSRSTSAVPNMDVFCNACSYLVYSGSLRTTRAVFMLVCFVFFFYALCILKRYHLDQIFVTIYLFWKGDVHVALYKGHLESKERFAIQRYLLIIGKKQNMQVLSHTFTYFT